MTTVLHSRDCIIRCSRRLFAQIHVFLTQLDGKLCKLSTSYQQLLNLCSQNSEVCVQFEHTISCITQTPGSPSCALQLIEQFHPVVSLMFAALCRDSGGMDQGHYESEGDTSPRPQCHLPLW